MTRRCDSNDSSNMKAILQHFDPLDKSQKKENNRVTEQSPSDACFSSSGACTSMEERSQEEERDEAGRMPREEASSPCPRNDEEWDEAERMPMEEASSLCPLSELKQLPQCGLKLGRLRFSNTHTVLIDVDIFNCGEGIVPQVGRDMWQSNFVKMPCSGHNLMTVKTGILKQPANKWRWDVIAKQLKGLAKKTSVSVDNMKDAIIIYNPKYKGQWSFDALATFVQCIPETENYFHQLVPKIAALALSLPDEVQKAIPLLQRGHTATITLSQRQISCLLANAFFCTFPHRNTSAPGAEYHQYPSINFTGLFGKWSQRKREKLRAIMHYFDVVTDGHTKLDGLVTFERRCLHDRDIPNWRSSKKTMPKLYVSSHGSIEAEGTGMLQVDFACSWLGGGVLGSGLVQEEILFLMNPEMIVSRLFTEKLEDNECLVVTGTQQFSCYSGFGDSFEWAGPHIERLQRDKWARLQRQILAIDALNYKHKKDQYNMINITRELNKAYCGFKACGDNEPDIATGKWGCGAFNGDPILKAVIQLMAAAKAGRGLAFFTFGDGNLRKDLQRIHHFLVVKRITVGELFGLLEDFCSFPDYSHINLLDLIVKFSRGQL